MAENSQIGQITLWEKEKLLVTSNFSFSHSVFKRLALEIRKNQGLFRKGLKESDKGSPKGHLSEISFNPLPHNPDF